MVGLNACPWICVDGFMPFAGVWMLCALPQDFVYWNNKQNPSETVKLTADARAREEGTSEEAVQLDLEDIPDRIYSIIFMLSIHKVSAGTKRSPLCF